MKEYKVVISQEGMLGSLFLGQSIVVSVVASDYIFKDNDLPWCCDSNYCHRCIDQA
jgi:hypothetical protein